MTKSLLDVLLLLPNSQSVFETSPPSSPKPPLSTGAADAVCKQERAMIIEATLRSASPRLLESMDAPTFPACVECGQTRYWLTSGGLVLCGSKHCAGTNRFQIVALKLHSVH
jgi:hypothetical protein